MVYEETVPTCHCRIASVRTRSAAMDNMRRHYQRTGVIMDDVEE
jgi:hypothetical protein